jgi:hypothetical protein
MRRKARIKRRCGNLTRKDQILNHKAERWRAEERRLRSFIFMYVCYCGDRRENQGNANFGNWEGVM